MTSHHLRDSRFLHSNLLIGLAARRAPRRSLAVGNLGASSKRTPPCFAPPYNAPVSRDLLLFVTRCLLFTLTLRERAPHLLCVLRCPMYLLAFATHTRCALVTFSLWVSLVCCYSLFHLSLAVHVRLPGHLVSRHSHWIARL